MFNFDSIRKLLQNVPGLRFKAGDKLKKFLWGLFFFIAIVLIMTIDLIPNQIDLEVGQVSRTDITAPRTVTFVDQERTEELRNIAAESASKVFEEDRSVNNKIRGQIDDLFLVLEDTYQQELSEGDRREKVLNQSEIDLNNSTIEMLLKSDTETLSGLHQLIIDMLNVRLNQRIMPEDLPDVRNDIEEDVQDLDIENEYKPVVTEILTTTIQPNMMLNEEATEQRRREARSNVEPVKRTVRQGEIILRKGDVVTEDDIQVLEVLGLQKQKIDYLNITGVVFVFALLMGLIGYYFYRYRNEIWRDNNKLILMEVLVIIIMILAKIASIFPESYLMYLVPVAAVSILVTVLIGTDIAVILTVFLAFLVSLVFNFSFNIVLVSFIGGLVGIFSVSRVSQRSDLVRAGFYVSGSLLVLIAGLNLMAPLNNWLEVLKTSGMGVLNGVLVAILANGLLPYLENFFNLTSSVKLLELSNPSQPLLKKLLVEAPGTYHHSVIVGNLAETAADNIGADSLLARVGAYYHDIGKLKRPYFFTDNQFGGDNPHDKISANLSSLIIKSHVKDGVELARENKLPREIIDIIEQHHGTNLISYFYQQARQGSKHDEIKESEFRYDGPKPKTKEAAIIMLADIVEAAVRSRDFNKNNHNRIEVLVRGLIREKLTENQLDESDLTLRDLDVIVDSFVKVLTGIYHHRIEYPENLLQEMEKDGNND